MGRQDKLLSRFLLKPRDFTFGELKKLLKGFGYREIRSGRTAGSRVAFYNPDFRHIIRLHRPHPDNTMKKYQLDYVEEELRSRGVLK